MAFLDQKTPYVYIVRAEFGASARLADWHDWYDKTHIPDLLSVPGFDSASRFEERGTARRYLAGYEIESPAVFDEPRYSEVTGWGEWADHLEGWQTGIYELKTDLSSGPSI